MPRRVDLQRSFRQTRASALAFGCPGRGSQRVLSTKAMNTKMRIPAVNLERSAAAKLIPNKNEFHFVGFSHRSANLQMVISEYKVTGMSVSTSGPKVRKAGVLTNTVRQRSPAHSPPNWRP